MPRRKHVTALRLVAKEGPSSIDERGARLKEAKQKFRARIEGLRGSKGQGVRTSIKLFDAIERLGNPDTSQPERAAAIKTIESRVAHFSRVRTPMLSVDQQRDAMMLIIFLDTRSPAKDARPKACSLLAMRGSLHAKRTICDLFPGLAESFF